MKKTVVLITLMMIAGCATQRIRQVIPLTAFVMGDTIHYNGRPWAEIRRYFPFDNGNNPGQGSLTSGAPQYRGAALYYFQSNRLAWVYPSKGLDADIIIGGYSSISKGDYVWNWIIDPKISADGRSISYSKLSIWGTKIINIPLRPEKQNCRKFTGSDECFMVIRGK